MWQIFLLCAEESLSFILVGFCYKDEDFDFIKTKKGIIHEDFKFYNRAGGNFCPY